MRTCSISRRNGEARLSSLKTIHLNRLKVETFERFKLAKIGMDTFLNFENIFQSF